MRLGCILVLIRVLFASSRAYIHHINPLTRLNAIIVTWNEFWHYGKCKVGQNSLKKTCKTPFKCLPIASYCNFKCCLDLNSLIFD